MSREIENNQRILAAVEAVGGGYVWDAEVFVVTLMDVVPKDEFADSLCGLAGVQQIAIDASQLQLDTLRRLSKIRGLSSLVLNHANLTTNEIALLRTAGPEIVLVNE